MQNSINNYKQSIRNYFSFSKSTQRLDDLYTKSIALKNNLGYLIPICELHATDNKLIANFAQWRDANSKFFPSQFPVTFAGTERWLRNDVLQVEDRILFLVVDQYSYAVGHLGFANGLNDAAELEIDNVVRGVEKPVSAGIMHAAMEKLLDWAEEFIAPHTIFLRVFSDNQHAIEFYKKLNFQVGELIPLYKEEEGNTILRAFNAVRT